ncbi:helix-turn-helix domain-containing protein, partial [Streptomyces anthocyanicus]|uniref:helix-turn-helix domain-containing protein n=1 Tax=Streptomyces anthocyanicus TaxID=68174 RepID=UPI0036550004
GMTVEEFQGALDRVAADPQIRPLALGFGCWAPSVSSYARGDVRRFLRDLREKLNDEGVKQQSIAARMGGLSLQGSISRHLKGIREPSEDWLRQLLDAVEEIRPNLVDRDAAMRTFRSVARPDRWQVCFREAIAKFDAVRAGLPLDEIAVRTGVPRDDIQRVVGRPLDMDWKLVAAVGESLGMAPHDLAELKALWMLEPSDAGLVEPPPD